MTKPKVIEWDGTHILAELRELPPGRYVVERIDDLSTLTPEEEQALLTALDELDAGGGASLADVIDEIRSSRSHE